MQSGDQNNQLPSFSSIQVEQIVPTLKQVIAESRAELAELLKNNSTFTWDNLIQPLEEMSDRINKIWSPIGHLHAVAETESLRAAYKESIPLLTEYHTEMMQNEQLCKAVQSIVEGNEFSKLDLAQRKVLTNELRDFKLAGVNLPAADKARYSELVKELSKLTTQFAENVLDATQAWILHITDPTALKGLSEEVLKLAAQDAADRGKEGWVFTLEFPSYSAFMKFSENRELRWLMYEAYSTRASDQGPHAGQWDNTEIIKEILKHRHKLATLIGYKNFAEYSLATKMAHLPQRVTSFLEDLVKRSKSYGIKDMEQLAQFAKNKDGIDTVEAWDIHYYTEQFRQTQFSLSQQELKNYFPVDVVLEGMFKIVKKLYGINVIEHTGIDTWHPQVRLFEIQGEEGELRGYFYTDLYARPHKREGAWMDECRIRRKLPDGSIQIPIAFLTCNFTRPLGNQVALLTHDEVLTLFHEFGHCLHHLLTKVDYMDVSGINGVPWDAVEFPSQFFEFWCWDKESLNLISKHIETGEPIPDVLFNKMMAAKLYQPGMHMLRQLEFALFDFRIHLEFDPKVEEQVQTILNEVREEVGVLKIPSFNRFQNSFSHIFAGSYSAGYYSYKWAEVLASDAFSKFEENGVLNAATGREFLHSILERGGTEDPMQLFIEFRDREPIIEPLLRHSGIMEN